MNRHIQLIQLFAVVLVGIYQYAYVLYAAFSYVLNVGKIKKPTIVTRIKTQKRFITDYSHVEYQLFRPIEYQQATLQKTERLRIIKWRKLIGLIPCFYAITWYIMMPVIFVLSQILSVIHLPMTRERFQWTRSIQDVSRNIHRHTSRNYKQRNKCSKLQ